MTLDYSLVNIALISILNDQTENSQKERVFTYHNVLEGWSMKASRYAIRKSLRILASKRTSFKAFYFSVSFKLLTFTCLRA